MKTLLFLMIVLTTGATWAQSGGMRGVWDMDNRGYMGCFPEDPQRPGYARPNAHRLHDSFCP